MTDKKKCVPVYLLADEHKEFKALCKKDGFTMSASLRAMALSKINKRKRDNK